MPDPRERFELSLIVNRTDVASGGAKVRLNSESEEVLDRLLRGLSLSLTTFEEQNTVGAALSTLVTTHGPAEKRGRSGDAAGGPVSFISQKAFSLILLGYRVEAKASAGLRSR